MNTLPSRAQFQPEIRPASTQVNAICNAATFFVTALVAFLLTPTIVRAIGDTRYGILTLAGEFTGYYGLLDLGIRSAVGYYVSRLAGERRPAEVNEVIRTAFWNLSAVAAGIMVLAGTTAWYFPRLFHIAPVPADEARLSVGILLFAFAFNLPCSIPNGVLVGLRRFDIASACQIATSTAVALALSIVVLRCGGGLLAISVVQACGSILTCVLQAFCLRRLRFRVALWPPTLRSSKTREIYTFGGANLVMNIAQLAGFQMDTLIIGNIISTAAVSYYQFGRYLGMHLLTFVGSLGMTLPTAFTHSASKGDTAGGRHLYLQASRLIVGISTLFATGILIFGRAFLRLWIGDKYFIGPWYSRSDSVMFLMTVTVWWRCLAMVSYQYFLGTRQLRFQTIVRIAEAVVNLVTAIVLTCMLGIVGVSISKLLVTILGTAVVLPYCLKKVKVTGAEFAVQIALPAAAVAAATAASGLGLAHLQYPYAWKLFFAEAGIAGATGATTLWFVALDYEQRQAHLRRLRIW